MSIAIDGTILITESDFLLLTQIPKAGCDLMVQKYKTFHLWFCGIFIVNSVYLILRTFSNEKSRTTQGRPCTEK